MGSPIPLCPGYGRVEFSPRLVEVSRSASDGRLIAAVLEITDVGLQGEDGLRVNLADA